MASGNPTDISDFCEGIKLYFDEVEQMAMLHGTPTPCSHPSIQQIEKDIDTLGRLAFTAARTNQTPAIKKLLEDLKDAIPALQKAREWEIHQMTWTLHTWGIAVDRFGFYW